MKISKISIKNFRSIKDKTFDMKELNILIGNNGTGKTSILEAINYVLSPSFLSGRIKFSDFYNGTDEPIVIQITFDTNFNVTMPDGFAKQSVECNGVYLEVKKRDRGSIGKAFSDPVVVAHYVIPTTAKSSDGRIIKRKSGTDFKFTERSLSFPIDSDGLVKSFYFGKNREKQSQKGFNTSFNSLVDDFNRQFAKTIRTGEDSKKQNFLKQRLDIQQIIKDNIDKNTYQKTIETVNTKLSNLGIQGVDFSFIDEHTPFDNAYLCNNLDGISLPLSLLGSGIEIIISLVFLETLSSLSKENIVIIIDEPELHLHPTLQIKLVQYLESICKDSQIILSTHSPYFFKNCVANTSIELLITKSDAGITNIENASSNAFGIFPRSPSWGEINYHAYDLPTIEFHNELYGYLENTNKTQLYGMIKNKQRFDDRTHMQKNIPTSLSLYIRNHIHHPENTKNVKYTESELEQSIKDMLKIV